MARDPDRRSKNYNANERKLLRELKPGYMKCLNAAERKKYVSNFIWTALCEHWRRKTGNSEIHNAGAKAVVCGLLETLFIVFVNSALLIEAGYIHPQ